MAELGLIVYLPSGGSSWRKKMDFDYQRFVHLYFQLSTIHSLAAQRLIEFSNALLLKFLHHRRAYISV
jgi:hypothetical protein